MDYFALICSIFYIAAGIIAGMQLLLPNKSFSKFFLPIITTALLIHSYWLYQHIFLLHGQNLPLLNVLALVAFIVSLLLTLTSRHLSTRILLPIIYAFSVLNFIAINYLPSHYITHLKDHPELTAHIILALLAYSILTIASLFALQLAYLDYRLKNHKSPLTKINFPPLLSLEKTLFKFLFIGFIILTGALLMALLFVDNMFAPEQLYKTIFSLLAWLIYGVLLWGHFQKGWRGQAVVYTTLASSFLLTFAYFGIRLIQEIWLN